MSSVNATCNLKLASGGTVDLTIQAQSVESMDAEDKQFIVDLVRLLTGGGELTRPAGGKVPEVLRGLARAGGA